MGLNQVKQTLAYKEARLEASDLQGPNIRLVTETGKMDF